MSEYQAPPAARVKPGKYQAIAIMTLIDSILSLVFGLGWMFGIINTIAGTFGLGIVTLVCCPIPIYAITVGIFEIIAATKLMPEPPTVREFPQYLAIMQIVNIISGNILSAIVGVLALVFANDSEIAAYFASLPPEPMVQEPRQRN